jgi:hypothetical protein
MHKRTLAVGTALVVILLAVAPPGWAAPQLQARSIITYPADGMTVSGVVEITGVATHPNIEWYDVSYAAGAEPTGGSQWVPLAHVENAQVEDGVLATWDTAGVPDGPYSLALTVKGRDDPLYYQQFVTRLAVNNAQPVVTPTLETSTPEPMPTAVIGPTPTPVSIEQPATSTPRPSPTPRGEVTEEAIPSSVEEEEGGGMLLDADKLRAAFCTGGLITALLFLLWCLYLLAKAGVRWYLRQRPNAPWK